MCTNTCANILAGNMAPGEKVQQPRSLSGWSDVSSILCNYIRSLLKNVFAPLLRYFPEQLESICTREKYEAYLEQFPPPPDILSLGVFRPLGER